MLKAIAGAVMLFGVAMGSLMYVSSSESQHSWLVAAVVYVSALALVQFLQPMTTLKRSVKFNAVVGSVVTLFVFVDTVVLHQGIFKDVSHSGEGLLYRVVVLGVAIGAPTAILGSFLGLSIGRVLRNRRTKLHTQPSDPPMRA